MADFVTAVRALVEAELSDGETLAGLASATTHKAFSGVKYHVVGVTDRRLILQQVSRRGAAKGAPHSVSSGDVASGELDGAGDHRLWSSQSRLSAAVSDALALKLKLRTTAGEKLELQLAKGTGIGGYGASRDQQDGLVALAEWLRAALDDELVLEASGGAHWQDFGAGSMTPVGETETARGRWLVLMHGLVGRTWTEPSGPLQVALCEREPDLSAVPPGGGIGYWVESHASIVPLIDVPTCD